MRKSDKLIPWMFVAFFVVVAAVNGVFIYFAVHSYTGVVSEHAYEKGLAYNETLEKARKQVAMNIAHEAAYENGVLRLVLKDADGQPLSEAKVTAHILRPVSEGLDFDVELVHLGGGIYEVPIETPLPGRWRAELEATWDNTPSYQMMLDFLVRPQTDPQTAP